MELHLCQCCGAQLVKNGDHYDCPYCGSSFEDDFEERAAKRLSDVLNEAKLEALSNARRALYEQTHRENPSAEKTLLAASSVLALYPDDPLARFYEAALHKDPAVLNGYLRASNVDENTAKEFVRYGIKALRPRNVASLKDFVERHFSGKERIDAWTAIEEEEAKLEEGVYETSLPRDVFLAYSSADQSAAIEMADELEEQGFKVFIAYRNLRHGAGAEEDYLSSLYDAIAHCKAFLFLSSESSRSLSCDALRVEATYVLDSFPDLPRIEYILDDHREETKAAVKALLKEIFPSEWCTTKGDLTKRLIKATTKKPIPCPSCGFPNPSGTKFCARCGAPLDEKVSPKRKKTAAEMAEEEVKIILDDLRAKEKVFDKNIFKLSKHGLDPEYYPVEEDGEYYEISAVDTSISGHLYIPGEIDGKRIISVGSFRDCPNLKSVVIGEGILFIGAWGPFQGCDALEAVLLPDSLVGICESGFDELPSLKAINLPAGLKYINDYAFEGCKSLKAITIPSSIVYWHDVTFKESGLISVRIEGSEKIPFKSFESCENLENVEILSLGPKPLTEIHERAFANCKKLRQVHLPETLLYIGEEAFENCASLVSIDIPVELDTMDDRAFKGCVELTEIALPGGLGKGTFEDCHSLKRVRFLPKTTSLWKYPDGIFRNCYSLESIDYPLTPSAIGDEAFANCQKLKALNLFGKLESIGARAFQGCASLTSIVLPDTVKEIGPRAFEGCSCSLKLKKKGIFGYPKGFDKNFLKDFNGPIVN